MIEAQHVGWRSAGAVHHLVAGPYCSGSGVWRGGIGHRFQPDAGRMGRRCRPDGRMIDGHNLTPAITWVDDGAGGAFDTDRLFFSIRNASIEAVRVGPWKLHLLKDGKDVELLFHLADDISEQTDVAADHPEVVDRLRAIIEAGRADLGDERLNIKPSANVRPLGKVDNPQPLTEFDPNHPYFMAEYDLPDRG